jgi:nitrogen fixation/metabolism regulation signal transduction histidine kinase
MEDAPGSVPREELTETLGEMERDVDRLNKVAQRFSHVGSSPRLERQDVSALVERVVEYAGGAFRARKARCDDRAHREDARRLPCSRELLEWAIENLIANAISRARQAPGADRGHVSPRRWAAPRSRSRTTAAA